MSAEDQPDDDFVIRGLNADLLADGTDEQCVQEIWRWSRLNQEAGPATLWFIIGVLSSRLRSRPR